MGTSRPASDYESDFHDRWSKPYYANCLPVQLKELNRFERELNRFQMIKQLQDIPKSWIRASG
jgi:hypothetical protein